MLVGWKIFSDESAACQEKRAAFKYSEGRLKEQERWERKEELRGWVSTKISGRDAGLESWCAVESLLLFACGFNGLC